MDIIGFIIIVLSSSVVASIITLIVQQLRETRKQKLFIFVTLYSYRQLKVTPEFVNALNMIDIVFRKDAKVRQLWSEFYNLLNSGDATSVAIKQAKYFELLTEMAKVLRLSNRITHSDVSRFYYPRGLQEMDHIDLFIKQKQYDVMMEEIKKETDKKQ